MSTAVEVREVILTELGEQHAERLGLAYVSGYRGEELAAADLDQLGFGYDEDGEPTRRRRLDCGFEADPQPASAWVVDVDEEPGGAFPERPEDEWIIAAIRMAMTADEILAQLGDDYSEYYVRAATTRMGIKAGGRRGGPRGLVDPTATALWRARTGQEEATAA